MLQASSPSFSLWHSAFRQFAALAGPIWSLSSKNTQLLQAETLGIRSRLTDFLPANCQISFDALCSQVCPRLRGNQQDIVSNQTDTGTDPETHNDFGTTSGDITTMAYSLPDLPYAYDALEPHIDARTMEIHHTKHHQAYISKVNAALEGTSLAEQDILQVISDLSAVPDDKRGAVRNNGGGHANHSLFWTVMGSGSGQPGGQLAAAIESDLGGMDAFKESFSTAAATRFGSGWAWLIVKNGKLTVGSTANQDNPLMGEAVAGVAGTPILGLDVWEHAYYLNYQNRRPDYVAAFFSVINWDEVERRYTEAGG